VPGGGPPPHIHHREDETFQILEGEYEWTVGGKTFVAKKGATIFAPRGIPHTHRYLGQTPGRLMCVITPAGFEGFFEEIGALISQQQQEIPRVIEIAENIWAGDSWKSLTSAIHELATRLKRTPRKGLILAGVPFMLLPIYVWFVFHYATDSIVPPQMEAGHRRIMLPYSTH
jgi:hypothetical protein